MSVFGWWCGWIEWYLLWRNCYWLVDMQIFSGKSAILSLLQSTGCLNKLMWAQSMRKGKWISVLTVSVMLFSFFEILNAYSSDHDGDIWKSAAIKQFIEYEALAWGIAAIRNDSKLSTSKVKWMTVSTVCMSDSFCFVSSW